MAEYIKRQDSLNTGREKINAELTKANDNASYAKNVSNQANNKSDNAVNVANKAMQQSNSTQDQLDNVIIESGTSDAEVIQARTDEKGTTHNTLQKRINDSFDEVTTQLAEKANQSQVNQLESIKADKSYVDDRLNNLDGLQIKGYYDTLQDLQNAYPNGAGGLYTVGNALYGWNGSVWKKVIDLEVMPWAEFMTSDGESWVIN